MSGDVSLGVTGNQPIQSFQYEDVTYFLYFVILLTTYNNGKNSFSVLD